MELRIPGLKKLYNRHRGVAIAVGASVCLLILFFLMLGRQASTARTLAIKKTELERFASMSAQYLEKKAAIDMAARKARLASGEAGSAISEIERISGRVGAKELITSIKPLEETRAGGYVEKEFEVRIERMELNSLVNLLYLIENSSMLLVVREFSMKSRFEAPDLLDVRLKVAHLTRPLSN